MRLLTVLLLLLLSACGFQLRKDFVLPASLSPIRVEVADSFSPLQRNLEQLLRGGGAGVAAEGGSAGSVLRVPINSTRLAPLIVGQTGRVQEYVLFHTVEFELFDAGGTRLVERQRLELQREFLFDSIGAVGSPGEQELIARELETEMAQAIVRRLQVALDQ
jgi:LPS-assembly lipoprotein